MDAEPIVAGAAASGDGGAGGGDAGGVAVAEPTEENVPGLEGGEPDAGAADAEPGAPKEPAEPEDPDAHLHVDARIVDVKTRQQIQELRKTNPALAKVAADAIFSRQAVLKEFPEAKTVGDALKQIRAAKATLTAVGGEEGLTKIQDEVTDYRNEIEQFANGSPELTRQLHEANPDGLVRQTGNALELLAAKDPENFDKAIAVPFAQRIEKAGMPKTIDDLLALVKEGKGQEAFELLGKVKEWLGNVSEYAKQLGAGKTTKDPKADALAERERAADERDRASYEGSIGTDVNKLNNSALQPMLDPLFKKLNLQPEGRQSFTHLVQSKVWAAMKADKVFQRNARAIMAKGDSGESAKFINAKFSELLSGPDGIFVQMRNHMYPHLATAPGAAKKPAVPGAKPGAAAKPAVQYAGGRPKHETVDWNATSDIDWMRGYATLTDGKKIKFDPNSPPNKL